MGVEVGLDLERGGDVQKASEAGYALVGEKTYPATSVGGCFFYYFCYEGVGKNVNLFHVG